MISPATAVEVNQNRPPGPHNQNIKIVVQDSPEDPDHDDPPRQSSEKPESRSTGGSHNTSHNRFVLTDPVAFRYLEDDSAVTVLERRRELLGYEIYIVEQWATSRSHPTFVITTFTGDPQHKIWAGVLSVPTDEKTWSQRLRVYFKALNQYHARRRETSLGILMITNLSGFPSSLTVIPVPDGDLRKHRFDFFVNENLKRLGCSGRVGLTLAQPNGATIAKFLQLYRTSDKNKLYSSVVELVRLCQAALHLFDKLEIDYADGLLCDITEKAINDWWIGVGTEVYNIEPHDGILGPTTVAALLGLLLGARNRLNAVGATVSKDPFDVDSMKRGIAQFQKTQRIRRNRRLDRQTLDRLHKASAKAASAEGWSVPRAVKSTMAELSGEGGEMLAEVVGRRDKAGIADVETPDIERFQQLVYGERCGWLWQGKPLKNTSVDLTAANGSEGHLVFKSDEHGGFSWTGRKHGNDVLPSSRDVSGDNVSPQMPDGKEGEDPNREGHPHRSVTKRATGLINDGRRGFGKFKDAVGLRGHHARGSKDESPTLTDDQSEAIRKRPGFQRAHTSPTTSPKSPKHIDESLDDVLQKRSSRMTSSQDLSPLNEPKYTDRLLQSPQESQQSFAPLAEHMTTAGTDSNEGISPGGTETLDVPLDTVSGEASIAGSVYHGIDLHEVLPEPTNTAQEIGPLLRRVNSYSNFLDQSAKPRSDHFFPRHLSFSIAEDSTAFAVSSIIETIPRRSTALDAQYQYETTISSDLKTLRAAIATLDREEASWARAQIYSLRDLLSQAAQEQLYLESTYYEPLNTLQELRDTSAALLRDEKEGLVEGAKELETWGQKLDYEIGGLKGKIEDVEVAVDDFERAIKGVEDRIGELERDSQGGGVWHCVVC